MSNESNKKTMKKIVIFLLAKTVVHIPKNKFTKYIIRRALTYAFNQEMMYMLKIYGVYNCSISYDDIKKILMHDGWSENRIRLVQSLLIDAKLIEKNPSSTEKQNQIK